MKKYCTSLELSKKLYALGIVTDAQYWWNTYDNSLPVLTSRSSDEFLFIREKEKVAPAPIFQELFDTLTDEQKDRFWGYVNPHFENLVDVLAQALLEGDLKDNS